VLNKDLRFLQTIKVNAIYAAVKLELEKAGKLNMLFLLRWAGRMTKAIGVHHISNAIEQKRLTTWVKLQRLNGAKHVTLELTYLGRRYLLVKGRHSNVS